MLTRTINFYLSCTALYNYVIIYHLQVQQLQSTGIDWNGPLPFDDDNIVNVDPPQLPLNPLDFQELCININPLEPSSEYGMELYTETVHFVINKVMASTN